MSFRTDLATEAVADTVMSDEDVTVREERRGGARWTYIRIRSRRGEERLGKPRGQYVTMELPSLSDNDEELTEHARRLGGEIRRLLPKTGTVLVVGLGNESITPDAIGPLTVKGVLATRHIEGEFARSTGLDDLRPTAVMATGVVGKTGVESVEWVRGMCDVVHPSAVIAVDALASRSADRLGCTVQMCDGGIAPGSGVGNARRALGREELGVPVIALGVPTVVDARTLVADWTDLPPETLPLPARADMMVTPREIDLIVQRSARLLALALNGALQPDYSPLELYSVAQ